MTALKDWLILLRTPGLGATRLRSLIDEFHSPDAVLSASDRVLRERQITAAGLKFLRDPDQARIDVDLAWLDDEDHHLITFDDPRYPPQLKDIAAAPVALFVFGDPECLQWPQLAIVGSRNATPGGLKQARRFAEATVRQGLAVTSGLALGVDGAAHGAALDAGGLTIAVAATGLDRVYPARHRALAQRIVQNGCLVSEFPPGTEPRAGHFPRRNRIISGLSVGTLVVEAGTKSGSLITAHFAAEQGREVFAMPGSIHNPLARGCHLLIKQGAKLVETSEDVAEEIAPRVRSLAAQWRMRLAKDGGAMDDDTAMLEASSDHPNLALDGDYRQLLDAMGFDPITVDELVNITGQKPEAVSSMLLILELSGLVEAGSGGSYCRTGEEIK